MADTNRVTVVLNNATTNSTLDTTTVGIVAKSGDLDGDGLTNERELTAGTNVSVADTDGDGLEDGKELDYHATNPTVVDSDGDSLGDGAEVDSYVTDPTRVDSDDDGITDDVEVQTETRPTVPDTDRDGISDGREVELGTDPVAFDTDDDGLTDFAETQSSTDPLKSDTDGDGLTDGTERDGDTSPIDADVDDDGLEDGRELVVGTDPVAADTDGDGLSDRREFVELGTDPVAADTDGDFVSDEMEVALGVDPVDSLSPAWITGGIVGFAVGAGLTVVVTRRDRDSPRPGLGWVVPTGLRRAPATLRALVGSASKRTSETVVRAVSDSPDQTPPTEKEEEKIGATEVVARAEVELVSDAELVERMLDAESGRMRQSEIVEATGWSKAKVSRRLSAMEDDGDIVKVRVGRENLICLDDAIPELATSGDGLEYDGANRLTATATGQ